MPTLFDAKHFTHYCDKIVTVDAANLVGMIRDSPEPDAFIGPYRILARLAVGGEGESFVVDEGRTSRGRARSGR